MNPNTHPEQLQVLGAGLAVWGLKGNAAAQPEAGTVGRAGYSSVHEGRDLGQPTLGNPLLPSRPRCGRTLGLISKDVPAPGKGSGSVVGARGSGQDGAQCEHWGAHTSLCQPPFLTPVCSGAASSPTQAPALSGVPK